MHQIYLILHLISACVWIGGHIILCLGYLPRAIKNKDVTLILHFEQKYEPIGIPALLILVITGILLSYNYGVEMILWFNFQSDIVKIISFKIILLFFTFLLAIHARFFLIPHLSINNLWLLTIHIVSVTVIGLFMLVLGTFIRFGGL